jgi:hypothetical protein
MPYLLLYGTGGWTQRWQIADGDEDQVRTAINRVGTDATGFLTIVGPGTEDTTTLVVAWRAVAAALVVDSDTAPSHAEGAGPYA